MPVTLSDESRTASIGAIKHYFLEEREEEIGDLQASFLLDFFLEEIAPSVYNQAVRDTQAVIQNAVVDLDVVLSEPEIGDVSHRKSRR